MSGNPGAAPADDTASLATLGQRLADHRVRDTLFVHGTFVGFDPLGMFADGSLLERVLSFFGTMGLDELRRRIREGINQRIADVGNFIPSYVDDWRRELGDAVCRTREPVVWSGGNSHGARLAGTVRLAATLADSIERGGLQGDDRVLLFGHSHAGQLFALLTHLLQHTAIVPGLLTELAAADREALELQLELIRRVQLDFVTLGTPVRYRWAPYERYRLLPVINHRSNSRFDLDAIANVADGDYVQQWGTEGTDMPTLTASEKHLSALLDDAGFSLFKALDNVARSAGQHPQPRQQPLRLDGTRAAANVLVDYQDQRPAHNTDPLYCGKVVLGHGAYTMRKWLGFNAALVAEGLYR